ncbi:MAG: hypothetical protein KGR42_02230 [Acidobacteria bacterium]|nr:hypothetical protein [Acidobacteriota bacterium]
MESESYTRRVRLLIALIVASVGVLVAWIPYLAYNLPVDYRTQGWVLAWVGYDVAMLAVLAVCAWALWRHRQVAIPAALVGATMLVIDAWFDMATARSGSDFITAVATAVFAELPLAAVLFYLARRFIRATMANAQRLAGVEVTVVSLIRAPLAWGEGLNSPRPRARPGEPPRP